MEAMAQDESDSDIFGSELSQVSVPEDGENEESKEGSDVEE